MISRSGKRGVKDRPIYGTCWSLGALRRDFEVITVIRPASAWVRRKSDSVYGVIEEHREGYFHSFDCNGADRKIAAPFDPNYE